MSEYHIVDLIFDNNVEDPLLIAIEDKSQAHKAFTEAWNETEAEGIGTAEWNSLSGWHHIGPEFLADKTITFKQYLGCLYLT